LKQNTYNIIILAAGGSSRLGRPKQLLSYNNSTLVRHAVDEAVASGIGDVIVVLGADAERISADIKDKTAQKVTNRDWQEGIASSIRIGIQTIDASQNISGILLMVCDQPYVDSSVLLSLITTHERTGKPIVACQYRDTAGTPVFFHQSYFDHLVKLQGDTGAKKIILNDPEKVELVPFFRGEIDIDSNDDYTNLLSGTFPVGETNQ
jgi:molybdenum cofactor cytidylyltransferase